MKEPQHVLLLNHWSCNGGTLTVWSAINKHGIYALSQRANELIRVGFPIRKEWVHLDNGKKVMGYSM